MHNIWPSKKLPVGFLVFTTLICLAIIIMENINNKYYAFDFSVYYQAAEAFVGGNSIYGYNFPPSLVGYYKYSPFILLFFVPYTLFAFKTSAFIHYAIISLCAIGSVFLSYHIFTVYVFERKFSRKDLFLSILFVFILLHLVRELLLGNINLILMMILLFSVILILKQKHTPAGILLAITLLAKPYLSFIMLPLIAHKKWKVLFSIVFTVLLSFLLPAVFIGITDNISLHKEWFSAMLQHNQYIQSHQTLSSILGYYFFPDVSNLLKYYLYIIPVAGYPLLYLYNRKRISKYSNRDSYTNNAFIMEIFIIVALLPNIFLTDSQQFLFALPLITFLVLYISAKKKYILGLFFLIVIFFYGGNSTDLIGNSLSMKIFEMGFLGMANLLIIILAIIYSPRSNL